MNTSPNTSLHTYNQKRDFTKTAEPKGITKSSRKKLRYVIQHHMARREHYDFRLEWQGSLLSWAVPKGPSYNPKHRRLAVHVEDHPLDYRNFEGTIPKGEYGGGTVMLWDEGTWTPQYDVQEGLDQGNLKIEIHGKRLRGKWALIQIKKPDENQDNWLLIKENDEYVQTDSGITQYLTSIRTGRTMDEIAKEESMEKVSKSESNSSDKKQRKRKAAIHLPNPFTHTEVQQAKLVDKIPEEDDWLYEMKYDGYRILAYVEANQARLMTRNDVDYTQQFTSIAESLVNWADERSFILDGEMVVVDKDGKTSFQALQNYMRKKDQTKLTYIVFDLLAYDGKDMRSLPLVERKQKLVELMQDIPSNLHYSKHIEGNGKKAFAVACQSGMEGIVGKLASSSYVGKRNGDWIKLKCDNRQEFVIAGFTRTIARTSGISALLLGVYEDGKLVYVGRAGTGLSQKDMDQLMDKAKKLIRKRSAFINPPKEKVDEAIIWLKPELVAEIKFAEWTNDSLLRQASYQGLRVDKNAIDVRRE